MQFMVMNSPYLWVTIHLNIKYPVKEREGIEEQKKNRWKDAIQTST